ncbi:MAG: bifunctional UDP-N-acetylglucosamine diphosphorylase/glucosamine-1-phosphate N-acetyltransferase GlmU [Bacteroidetes bacterium]|nr:bifunctional UDP-N-acetylglucosamine diphosphorylase/glucosamine-1-phosphate N-acetyltransferase GlmU [Bacteroidota bacterium]MCL5025023.1 bifunctional UDP-N-acetylglucosamine diphosphorylase/glucosamine-1-phosphate N-acetyltransferase GlmU [Chloroflexota bacterium]
MSLAVVILAAGQGTRMKSRLPKVLHPVAGRPMLEYSLQAAAALGAARTLVVLGHQADRVRSVLPPGAEAVLQEPQLGTGHALGQARAVLGDACDEILVLYGDMPLLRAGTLRALISARQNGPASVLTARLPDPTGYGRILRDGAGNLRGIVEEAEATSEEKVITEVNCGIYCFQAARLWDILPGLPRHADAEYYLTDVIALAAEQGTPVVGVPVGDPDEASGINNRVQLARTDAVLRQRIRERLMLAGVTLLDPSSAFIDDTAVIAADTVVHPNTFIEGRTSIGEGCIIGPNTRVVDSTIGQGCHIVFSVLEEATLEENVRVGPFSHLRAGAHLCSGAYLGNYAEVKNSRLGPGTQMHHFSYIGDARVGANVNIAAGVITCNFNSETQEKYPTDIEDGVALGSDTMLVAPVLVGRGAVTGAGSVVTHDVPPETVVRGVPAEAVRRVRPRRSSASSASKGLS